MAKTAEVPKDLSVDVRDATGKASGKAGGKATLAGAVFGIEPNTAVMHQVVTAQLAAARAGTHSTLTRSEVRGGGSKPYRQKGTGRARQGSIRSPHWRGGGVAHGPKPRDYSQRTPKKMVRLALRSALSDRAAEGKVVVVGDWSFEAPKTKQAREALDALGVAKTERALIVLSHEDEAAWKSFRNLGGDRRVQTILDGDVGAYDVLVNDWIVFTSATLEAVTRRLQGDGPSDAGPSHAGALPASEAPSTDEVEGGDGE